MLSSSLLEKVKRNPIKTAGILLGTFVIARTAEKIILKKIEKAPQKDDGFAFGTIRHSKDSITFLLKETQGLYTIYRDGKLLYKGDKSEFADKGLVPGTLYQYYVEFTEEEEKGLSKKYVVQTATAVDKKSENNILKDLVITTVISEEDIQFKWEAIDGIDEYFIYRDQQLIGKTKTCNFKEKIPSTSKECNYQIKAKRPLLLSEQGSSKTNSAIAGVLGIAKNDTSKEQTAQEEFTLRKKIGPAEHLLIRPEANRREKKDKNWLVRYTTFLKEEWIGNPNIASSERFFKGDNRHYDPEANSYRTRTEITYDAEAEEATVLKKTAGITKAYDEDKHFLKEERASDEGIEMQEVIKNEDFVRFELYHEVGNPLVASPAINYRLFGTFYRNGTVDFIGSHDQAPCHEVYMKEHDKKDWHTVHQTDNKGLEMMAPQTANHLWRYTTFTEV